MAAAELAGSITSSSSSSTLAHQLNSTSLSHQRLLACTLLEATEWELIKSDLSEALMS
jgi:hypothetical protein